MAEDSSTTTTQEPMQKKHKKDADLYPYGNYPTYYAMRYKWKTPYSITAKDDPRLAVLSDNLPVGARLLDVGCNNGLFTFEVGIIKQSPFD